jgi:hypothetical protein
MADKVTATPEALQLLAEIVTDHGPVHPISSRSPVGRVELLASVERALAQIACRTPRLLWRRDVSERVGKLTFAAAPDHGNGPCRSSRQEYRRGSWHQPTHRREPSGFDHEEDGRQIASSLSPVGPGRRLGRGRQNVCSNLTFAGAVRPLESPNAFVRPSARRSLPKRLIKVFPTGSQHRQGVPPKSSRWQWRRRRPLSLEYIPSLGATTRSCSFSCFGCAGRCLRPWLRRLAAFRTPARTTPRSECSGGYYGRDSAMRAKVDRSGLRLLARERKPL